MTFLISLEQVPADTTVAIGLGIGRIDALLRLTRLRLADEEPTVYAMSHLPVRVVPTLDPASIRSPTFSLHTYLRERHDGAPTRCRARISPDVATETVATPLGLAVGTPILRLLAQTVHHAVGPVEFASDYIRADRFSVALAARGDTSTWIRTRHGQRSWKSDDGDVPVEARPERRCDDVGAYCIRPARESYYDR